MSLRPLVHLQPGESRVYRYGKPVRYSWLVGLPFGAWLIAHAELFADQPALQVLVMVAAVMMIVGPLLIRTQSYVLSDEGVTSRNVFRTKLVRWDQVKWVSLDHRLLSGQRYCIYTTPGRRWAYPAIAIPNWVEGFEDLAALIRDKVVSMQSGA
jgi:hypothetical protein